MVTRTPNIIARFLIVASLLPAAAHAGGPPDMNGWLRGLNLAFAWQGKGEFDNGGDFSVSRGIIEFEQARRAGASTFVGISLGYGEDRYSFTGLPNGSGWDDVRTVQLGVNLRHETSDKWSVFGLPILRYSAERDASLGDGREIGLLAGASYRFSDTLTIGPGMGLFSGIGGEEDIFPILLIDWSLTDTVSLETGRGLAASRGPGLSLKWRPSRMWEFSLAARYEKFRFRLQEEERIGEDKAVPVVLTAAWKWNPAVSITALAGIETSGDLSIEKGDGERISRLSYDTAPLLGLVATYQF